MPCQIFCYTIQTILWRLQNDLSPTFLFMYQCHQNWYGLEQIQIDRVTWKPPKLDSMFLWKQDISNMIIYTIHRSSHQRCSVKKGVLSPKACNFMKKRHRFFPAFQFWEISKITFFTELLRTIGSAYKPQKNNSPINVLISSIFTSLIWGYLSDCFSQSPNFAKSISYSFICMLNDLLIFSSVNYIEKPFISL